MGYAGLPEKEKRRQEVSKSKIFLLFLLSFTLGIAWHSYMNPGPLLRAGVLVFGVFSLAAALFKRNSPDFKRKIIFGCAILFLALGALRAAAVAENGSRSNAYDDKKITFEAEVVEEPDRRLDFSQYVAENKNLGRILVKTNLYPEYSFGDILRIKGKTAKPENGSDFDYINYLAKNNIYLVSRYPEIEIVRRAESAGIRQDLFALKKAFIENINKILPEPQASLLSALLVGAKKALPAELTEALKRTGTSHIVAISGYNISIIAVMIMNLFGYLLFPRRLVFWLAGGAIILFTLIAGAEASVVRAAIMGGLLMLAWREGRLYDITNAVVLAGAVMLWFNPRLLRYDAGFQLSFLSVLGLTYLAPYFEKYFTRLPNFLSFRDNLTATVSAQIATLPVIIFSFGNFSAVAVLANVLVLPAIPVSMLFGFLSGLTAFFSLKLASILALPAYFLLSYEVWLIKLLSLIPFASL